MDWAPSGAFFLFAITANTQAKTIGLKRRAGQGASPRGDPPADIGLTTAVSDGTIEPGAEPVKSAEGAAA